MLKKGARILDRYIFTYEVGKETPVVSMKRVDRSFAAALKRAGIEDFRFHDLRHTFASHFIMRGGRLKELQEILGHKDIKMTMRYAHLSQEHKKKAVNLLNGLTASRKTPKAHLGTFSEGASYAKA
jgi:integrase